jgi:protein-S-isoprenylcysteine O-methyltransferase Ste14
VRDEERLLDHHLGAAWQDYRRRTGAFLPRLGSPRQS